MRQDQLTELLCATLRKAIAGGSAVVPEPGRLVWRWFLDLSRTRSGSGFGGNPITYAEIEAYSRLYRWPLEPRHIDMLLAMDREWFLASRPEASPDPTHISHSQPITAEAFDAVFL